MLIYNRLYKHSSNANRKCRLQRSCQIYVETPFRPFQYSTCFTAYHKVEY